MSAHLERARLLLAQSRPLDAENESMLALTQQPDNPQALAVLALSRVEQGKREAALESAQKAVSLAPDEAYFHGVLAHVLRDLGRTDDAFAAINNALRLDPLDASHFALLASIELTRGRWAAALEASENALAVDPEHVAAANLRAMALVRLGRKAEAMESVDYALSRAPEDAFSHANQGWNHLHRNNPRAAQEHFREALRLNPELDYAREGMIEALKARNPIYRGMLAYFLWLGRQSARFQWAFVLGIFFGTNVARSLSASQPQLQWLWWPLMGLFYAFVYLSWTAHPMFNLALCFDRFGRHVLSPDQRRGAACFGVIFIAGLAALGWWLASGNYLGCALAVIAAVLSICVAATFARLGRARIILAAATGIVATLAFTTLVLVERDHPGAASFLNAFSFSFIGFQVLANVVSNR